MKNYLPKLLITGGHGQIAQALLHHPHAKAFDLVAHPKQLLDITDEAACQRVIQEANPDFVVNTAAYTAVDNAEQEAEKAEHINHVGARNVAMACEQQDVPLIHLSTDYVFDGKKTIPYCEEDTINPINVYGKTKWLGEQAVRTHCQQHIILRVSAIFSEYGHNFLKTILRLATEKPTLHIVADQITCPTAATDIAVTVLKLAKQPLQHGTYHYCSADPVSWHQFASYIATAAKTSCDVQAISTSEYPTAATRPAYSVLDCHKIKRQFGIEQPSWQSAVDAAVTHLIQEIS